MTLNYNNVLNRNSSIYKRFSRMVETIGVLRWVLTDSKVIAKVTPGGSLKKSETDLYEEFDYAEINDLSPILLKLIMHDVTTSLEPTVTQVKTSWKFWHDTGDCVKDNGIHGLYVKTIYRANTNRMHALITNEDETETNVTMEGYTVFYSTVDNRSYPYASLVIANKSLPDAFLNKHFPTLLSTYKAGLAVGVDPVEIEKIWKEQSASKVQQDTLPNMSASE